MSFRRILPVTLLAAAALLPGCGAGDVEPPAAAVVRDAPESRATPGWDAPAAVAGRRLEALSDDFGDPRSLETWGYVEGDNGRNRFMVERNARGELDVMPSRGAWVDGERAFFLFKQVRGDFDVSMRLRVSGRSGASGLLVRARPPVEGGRENWVGLRLGAEAGDASYERVTTVASRSAVDPTPAQRGWTDLRIIRRAERFVLLRRRPGGPWRRHWTYDRPDLPRTLQVGIDAFSGHGGAHPDLVSHVDWVRFRSV